MQKNRLSNRMSNNSDKKNNDTKPLFAINIPLYYPIVMARSINNIPLPRTNESVSVVHGPLGPSNPRPPTSDFVCDKL